MKFNTPEMVIEVVDFILVRRRRGLVLLQAISMKHT